MQDINDLNVDIGVVKISDEVVGVIAGIAASEVKGIANTASGFVNDLTQKISGKKNNARGVKVTLDEDSAIIELNVVVEYGVKIPEVAAELQENVKKTVEALTGLNVENVNIIVQNIYIPKAENAISSESEA
ncbi:Asp23/Gls24 family envelope stress response protein [Clostridium cellulovorans]|uniref:Asp23 family protein n=1 Tax=Clostridium cellulovorans (strain ATCC 35296 / DSM 3052 / OCM 3 / 743B) TaxID=573061 RepID=D9SLU4_CLOC7|nr:Asp23/Gls24 family envelope stress response protein [Clostridium cellulovorans]ADL51675.1 protein of unknown function DUF322 [Clostridium cellulovorans 743B]